LVLVASAVTGTRWGIDLGDTHVNVEVADIEVPDHDREIRVVDVDAQRAATNAGTSDRELAE
jgi:hypothetical protein